jgi:hypothetical protein
MLRFGGEAALMSIARGAVDPPIKKSENNLKEIPIRSEISL